MEKQPFELLLEALKKNELAEYLIGAKEYSITERLVEYPTNIGAVFSLGLNKYCETYGKHSLDKAINEALLQLLKTPEGSWWVITLINDYLFGFIPGKLLFQMEIELLKKQINSILVSHKDSLIREKKFVGYRSENGLWGDIENMVNKINKETPGEKIRL